MHHLPDDRTGPDDRDLHDEVVEAGRLEARQRRHLRARFDLEDADRVGLLQHPVDRGIVLGKMRQIDTTRRSDVRSRRSASPVRSSRSTRRADSALSRLLAVHQRDRVLQHRHHAEAEQIDLHDPHVGAVVLVPLHDHAAGHAGVLERHDGVELALADHHAAGMLAEMPRQILHLAPEPREQLHAIRVQIEPDRRPGAAAACRPDR